MVRMHEKAESIVKNLGFDEDIVERLERATSTKDLAHLNRLIRKLKIPLTASKQIKTIENINNYGDIGNNNSELATSLLKKCKRSFDSFARKNIKAHVVFKEGTWVLYSEEFSNPVRKFHKLCKSYFDHWASKGLDAILIFTGANKWKAKIKK